MYFIAVSSTIISLLIVPVQLQINNVINCTDANIQRLCLDQETCDKCLQADPCCNWCYDVSYVGRKCNFFDNLADCNINQIEINSRSGSQISEEGNRPFTDGEAEEVVQIKPQLINVKLGKDIPVNLTFTYKAAKNYPLDLYYLGDLSVSMREHLSIFKTLGKDLPNNLTQLTKNYKLAYGSFLDKIGMPFYFTAPESFNNPCLSILDDCEQGYLFKHRLSFTKDTGIFVEKVSSSKITANVDDLDGALDAILQILVCDEKMGWSVHSRKIILLPTDSLLHSAGDGILVGAVLQPNSTCLMDNDGEHGSPLMYDYPSVGQIDALLKEKKVNIIFAVKNKIKLEYYKNLTSELLRDSSFVGELEENSNNILQLITKGFYNFARQVSFSINNTASENLDIKFFADCDGYGVINQTSGCYNVEENSVDFTVQLTLKGAPTKKHDVLYIEEKNINEKIMLNITYIGICDCSNYDGEVLECKNGASRCGQCICDDGWTGARCEENCDETDNFNSCRSSENGIISSICHRNGDCICGKCRCYFSFTGRYCEYKCPVYNGNICSGLTQGVCIEGDCDCKKGFTGKDCSCSTSTTHCKLFEAMSICSGNGKCTCNKCKCDNGFSGQYCEVSRSNNTLCEDYRLIVEDAVVNGTYKTVKGITEVVIEEVDDETMKNNCGNTICKTVSYVGNSFCEINFCYVLGKDGAVHLLVRKICSMTASFKLITTGVAAFIAVLVGGLLLIAYAKLRIYRLEQAEYRQFQNERKNLNELNPIYKDPVTTYRNPMSRKND